MINLFVLEFIRSKVYFYCFNLIVSFVKLKTSIIILRNVQILLIEDKIKIPKLILLVIYFNIMKNK